MCEYKFLNEQRCIQPAFEGSKHCILHMDFSEDERSEEFKRINTKKEEKFQEKIQNDNFDFEGAKLSQVDLGGQKLQGIVTFANALIKRFIFFTAIEMKGTLYLSGAKIGDTVCFNGANIEGEVHLNEAEIHGPLSFNRAKINGYVFFNKAKVHMLSFNEAEILGSIAFNEAVIGSSVSFDYTRIAKELIFKDAKFKLPRAQEEASRKARRIYEELGNRGEADYYFRLEMRAQRLRRPLGFIRGVDAFFIDFLFNYGTNPIRVFLLWIWSMLIFAFIYFWTNGIETGIPHVGENFSLVSRIIQSVYFSVMTITTLSYGDYYPKAGLMQLVTSFEAFWGTFLWAIFIVIFARKYMR